MTSVSSAPSPPAGSMSSGLRQVPSPSVAGSVINISGSPASALASPVSANDLKQFKVQMQKLHQNQLSKITFKSEADIEFLETLKEYMQKRSELEMQHAKVILDNNRLHTLDIKSGLADEMMPSPQHYS